MSNASPGRLNFCMPAVAVLEALSFLFHDLYEDYQRSQRLLSASSRHLSLDVETISSPRASHHTKNICPLGNVCFQYSTTGIWVGMIPVSSKDILVMLHQGYLKTPGMSDPWCASDSVYGGCELWHVTSISQRTSEPWHIYFSCFSKDLWAH